MSELNSLRMLLATDIQQVMAYWQCYDVLCQLKRKTRQRKWTFGFRTPSGWHNVVVMPRPMLREVGIGAGKIIEIRFRWDQPSAVNPDHDGIPWYQSAEEALRVANDLLARGHLKCARRVEAISSRKLNREVQSYWKRSPMAIS